jgi:hypothetical protein
MHWRRCLYRLPQTPTISQLETHVCSLYPYTITKKIAKIDGLGDLVKEGFYLD